METYTINFKKSKIKTLQYYKLIILISFTTGIVLTDPRTEAEEYQFSNKKFESDVASSGISHQDLQMSPVIGFHSMSKDEKQEKSGPRFDIKTMRRTMTAINGKSVELSCSVIDLGNKTVRHLDSNN